LARTYASADAMVFPSATDTFGNVVLEAQAAGVPVVVTDRGGPADIVRCYDSGIIVDHAQPGALVDGMERLYLSAELRAELRARGLRNAAECQWEKVLEGFWARDAQCLKETDLSAYRSADPNSTAGVIELDLA
jgi:glycosyltransferase involved in cell wall biosynthesis